MEANQAPKTENTDSAQTALNTFKQQRQVAIESLNLTVEEYIHPGTGAVHLHLASDNPENVFMVALRTVPEDSTGVAHILEHTALCGSERYPVRDPFFMMLRRSLNTFMNAFTSSDWTAYPFATQNRKDFSNLLSVYLDAVFFSRLDPLDFAQEGHRVEFEKQDDGEALVFKGVVFNEMKGAMSSTSSVLWDRLCFELFPTNTYHFNSGGDPEAIPDLSYQQLRDFYTSHYHPSNAIFLTFGDIPAQQHQGVFEELVLQRFERSDDLIEVALETPFEAPIRATHQYALDSDDTPENKTHYVMGWKLGESADLVAAMEAQLLSAVLMENSASPLMQFLETTSLGAAPSPLCGVEESLREMVFCCGIEGGASGIEQDFEEAVLKVISDVAANGVDAERVEAILHQIELHQREITGDGMPYGLNLMLRALSAATHRGDPVAAMDLDPVLATIRERITQPDYIPGLINRLLIDNPHRVTLTVEPDPTLSSKRRDAEKDRLAAMEAELAPQQKAEILDLAEKLRARQSQQDDPDILPRVELDDIPGAIPEPTAKCSTHGSVHAHAYAAGTNGLVYQQWVRPLPNLTSVEAERLPLLTGLLTEVGIDQADYLAVQDRQSATVGSIGAGTLSRSAREDNQRCQSFFLMSSKALANRVESQTQLMLDTLLGARFDEGSRIVELVSQMRARRDQSITGSGHSLAMTAATAGMNPIARRSHEQAGLEGIRRLRALDDGLKSIAGVEQTLAELASLHTKLQSSDGFQLATITDGEHLDQAEALGIAALKQIPRNDNQGLWSPSPVRESRNEYWVANTQVNFCARAFPTVPSGHPDAPLLTVLAAFLRNGYLHRTLREQGGAYGGGASHDANIGAFRFFSFRDPRVEGTLNDFDAAVQWFIDETHDQLALEEAILGVIASMDKPGSPAGEAKKHFHETLFGRTADYRAAFRQGITGATLDELRRVADTYLAKGTASTAIITSPERARQDAAFLTELGLERQELL